MLSVLPVAVFRFHCPSRDHRFIILCVLTACCSKTVSIVPSIPQTPLAINYCLFAHNYWLVHTRDSISGNDPDTFRLLSRLIRWIPSCHPQVQLRPCQRWYTLLRQISCWLRLCVHHIDRSQHVACLSLSYRSSFEIWQQDATASFWLAVSILL